MGSGLVYPFYRDSRTSERNDGSCRRGSRWNANRYASSDGRKDGWSRHDGWRRRHDEQGHERHDERPEKVIQSQLDERRFYARSDRLRGRKVTPENRSGVTAKTKEGSVACSMQGKG